MALLGPYRTHGVDFALHQLKADESLTFVEVPAGTYTIGRNKGEFDQRPQHTVELDRFLIARTEVTNAQFARYLKASGRKLRTFVGIDEVLRKPDHPVVGVTHRDAIAFCNWYGLRLPTENQWEAAARSKEGNYPWGEQSPFPGDVLLANSSGFQNDDDHQGMRRAKGTWADDGFALSAPVGSFPKGESRFGALDMAGNVAEWCLDVAGSYLSRVETGTGFRKQRRKRPERILRGGSYRDPASFLTTTYRDDLKHSSRGLDLGFRPVKWPVP